MHPTVESSEVTTPRSFDPFTCWTVPMAAVGCPHACSSQACRSPPSTKSLARGSRVDGRITQARGSSHGTKQRATRSGRDRSTRGQGADRVRRYQTELLRESGNGLSGVESYPLDKMPGSAIQPGLRARRQSVQLITPRLPRSGICKSAGRLCVAGPGLRVRSFRGAGARRRPPRGRGSGRAWARRFHPTVGSQGSARSTRPPSCR
jgi:hypothetical protein